MVREGGGVGGLFEKLNRTRGVRYYYHIIIMAMRGSVVCPRKNHPLGVWGFVPHPQSHPLRGPSLPCPLLPFIPPHPPSLPSPPPFARVASLRAAVDPSPLPFGVLVVVW